MAIAVRWLASLATSRLHAADALLRGCTLVDPRLAAALAEPAAALAAWLTAQGIELRTLDEHLVPLAIGLADNHQLAEVALSKAIGPREAVSLAPDLARYLERLEAVFQQTQPEGLQELQLRAGPLRDQWEARGPGLMAAFSRLTEPELLVASADVLLVHPVLGGGGAAHPLYNSVRLEALLANPIGSLPEVVRLGWLLTQLQCDLPRYQGAMKRDRAAYLAGVATLPAIAQAAQEVELTPSADVAISMALQHWSLGPIDSDALDSWWQTYCASRPAWPVALGALDSMLA